MKHIKLISFILYSLFLSIYVAGAIAGAFHTPGVFLPAAAGLFTASMIPVKYNQAAFYFAINAKNILYPQGKLNPGGTAGHIFWAYDEDIESYPEALDVDTETALSFDVLATVPVDDPFVMKTGKFFHKLYCTLETGEVKFSMVGPRDSKSFENIGELSFPGNEAEFYGFLAATANRKIAAVFLEQNGKHRVIAHPRFPAQVDTAEGTSGKLVADGRATVVTIKAASGTPAPIYLAPIPLAPVTP